MDDKLPKLPSQEWMDGLETHMDEGGKVGQRECRELLAALRNAIAAQAAMWTAGFNSAAENARRNAMSGQAPGMEAMIPVDRNTVEAAASYIMRHADYSEVSGRIVTKLRAALQAAERGKA